MFCSRCGTQNNDASNNCVNCGAPLRIPQYNRPQPEQPVQQPMQQPVQQPVQQPYYGYAQPRTVNTVRGPKPTALYIIAGVIAVISFALVFIPGVYDSFHAYNPFSIAGEAFSSSGRSSSSGILAAGWFLVTLFVIPMALQVVWAIMSFAQKRPAGVFGIISSSIYFFSAAVWAAFVIAESRSSSIHATPVPLFMILLAVAGLPVSIVQLVKKKYL